MESIKNSLGLLMATAQFEDRMMGMVGGEDLESNKGLRKEMRRLRRLIKHHLMAMQDLPAPLGHNHYSEREASSDSLDPDLMRKNALIELGWSIYESGRIPISPPISPSSSVPNHSSQPPDTHRRSRRRRRSTTPHPVHLPRQASPEPPDPPVSEIGPVLSSEDFSEPPSDIHKTLRYGKDDVTAVTSGYVTDMNNIADLSRWRQTTASVVESLDGNFISIHKARELNLDIDSPSLTENVMFDFGTGKLERSFGKTTFKWRPWNHADVRYPSLIITCDVCENSTVGLVLGTPFLDERERLWP
ncbi:predicted protein [Chaetomium globosum CBS 148.51]|uniref:Uncharacterized protein n=1 Tax=Chaetomium globosum (strain ATCC 6205 / CBS 148.51 / DSM 1962 / NBRC 6347 / NRRL 1970) TaxID=306901 RepID=Q2GWW8_CHAGB|nr:uncharacterized protein CHGG_07536 [Chaetomium globosum CBS 148.51]EAQ86283.1 predicted protein [Chaetomium globosum CBS 148.51]